MTRTERIERNLRLCPVYQALWRSLFWVPVFFLYYLSVLSLEEAVLLEAIYCVTAVLLEVPSGWLSDRLGRRPEATSFAALAPVLAAFAAGGVAVGLLLAEWSRVSPGEGAAGSP